MNTNKRLIGYMRVSTMYQQNSGAGLLAQETMIKKFCKEHGFFLLELFQETESGGEDERPIFLKAIQECKDQNANLIVAKLDRLSRRVATIASFSDTHGIEFYVANLGLEINKTLLYLLAIFAELERDMISKRVKEGIEQKKRKGEYKKPPGNKNVHKLGGNKVWSDKTKAFRQTIFKEMEFISKRNPEQTKNIEYYVTEMNKRGNRTQRGKEWNRNNLGYLLREYPEEMSGFDISIQYYSTNK